MTLKSLSRLLHRFSVRRSRVRSSSVPVLPALSRLPPELLCAIFRLLSIRSCVTASRVSSRWRDTALGDPVLWASLDLAGLATPRTVLEELLARSGALPVDLRGLRIVRRTAEAVGLVLSAHFHRLRTIELLVPTAADFAVLCESVLMRTSAPLLETLSISTTFDAAEFLEITGPLFAGCASHLQRLTLNNVRIASTAYAAFDSLTELICINPPVVWTVWGQAESMLEHFPHLRSVEMHTTCFRPYGRILHTPPRVVYSSSADDAMSFLEATFALGHQEITTLELNCPYSAQTLARVLTPLDNPFSAIVHMDNVYPDAAYLCITYEDGRVRNFLMPVDSDRVFKALENVAQHCTALTCPALLLSCVPALPNLRDLTIELDKRTCEWGLSRPALSAVLAYQHTPSLRTLTIQPYTRLYKLLPARPFCEFLQKRVAAAAPLSNQVSDIVLNGMEFECEPESDLSDLRGLVSLHFNPHVTPVEAPQRRLLFTGGDILCPRELAGLPPIYVASFYVPGFD